MNHNKLLEIAASYARRVTQEGQSTVVSYFGQASLPIANSVKFETEKIGGKAVLIDNGGQARSKLFIEARKSGDIEKYLAEHAGEELSIRKNAYGFLAIQDDHELQRAQLDQKMMALFASANSDMRQHTLRNMEWLLVANPSKEFQQATGLSPKEFEDMFYGCHMIDYQKMGEVGKPLNDLMTKAESVRITGYETDLSFSIKGIGSKFCNGERNLPDGECFSAPVQGSATGHILYGASFFEGTLFPSIKLEIEEGIAVKSTVPNNKELTRKLNDILDRDEGARRFGEFAIAFNPMIHRPTGKILFDEKIAGSCHLAVGLALPQADNGNKSRVHWDMVKIQTPEFGGGDIIMDDELVRRDGLFVPERLKGLNPQNLIL